MKVITNSTCFIYTVAELSSSFKLKSSIQFEMTVHHPTSTKYSDYKSTISFETKTSRKLQSTKEQNYTLKINPIFNKNNPNDCYLKVN